MILFEDIIPMLGLIKKIFNQCKCKAIYIFDLVNDKVKTRLIIPIVIMFFVFIIVSSIFSGANSAKPYPTTFSVLIDPPIFMEIGTASRTFVVKVLDQNRSPMQEIEIELQIEDIVMDRPERDFNCDYFYLFSNYWNIKFMRNLGPCSIVILGNKIKTDYTGLGYFENFQFTSGPEGNYFVSFQVANHELSSSSYHILLSPTVYSIQMLNESPKIAYLDKPLNPQPNLIIKNKFDEPVTGKIVYAVSWPFPDYLQFIPPLFNPDGDKYAYLENSKSNPSDYEGRITFSNLTIVGSTHQTVYLRFVAEGIEISCPWKKLKFPIYRNYFSINIYIDPIIIVYKENNTIEQILSEELTIEEGKEFVNQPIFRILDSKQSPVTGIMCFALIRRFNRMNFPVGFYPTEYQAYPKSIFKMASGIYNDSKNISLHSFHSLVTDSSGIVEFQGMGISQGGTNYNQITDIGILFICGTAHSELKIINITTTVAIIEFNALPTFSIMVESFIFTPFQFDYYTIRVVDKNGNPIVNKQVNELILKNAISGSIIDVKIRNYMFIQFYYFGQLYLKMTSDEFGLITCQSVPYEVSTNSSFANYFFEVNVDGVKSISRESIFLIHSITYFPGICYSLMPINTTLVYNLIDNETLNLSLDLHDYYGKSYENIKDLKFTLLEKSFINALFYQTNDLSSLGYKFSIRNFYFILPVNQSILQIYNLPLINFFSGSYYTYFAIYTNEITFKVWDNEVNSCINPKPIVFHYINSVSKVLIMNQTNDSVITIKDLDHLLITLEICVKNNKEEFLKNFKINAESYIYDYSPVYSYDLYQNYQTLNQVLNIKANSTFTNEFGCLSIIVNPKLDYLGDLVFGILINGISSYPIKLKYEFRINSIEISESPDNKINYVVFESMKKPFKLKLNGAKNSINHVPVIAFFHGNGLSTHIDIFDEELSYVNFNSFRVNYSDSEGIVTFSNLTVLSYDNYSNAGCFIGFFYFKLATNLSAQSLNSVNYTFCKPDIKLYVEEKFSNPIFLNNYLEKGITGHFMEETNLLILNSSFPLIFNLKIVKFENHLLDSTVGTHLSYYLFNYFECNYKKMKEYSFDCPCNFSVHLENPIDRYNHYFVKFTNFYFNTIMGSKNFDLALCLYNYCNYSSQSLSGIALSFTNKEFKFLVDFPSVIKIKDYVVMVLHPTDVYESIPYISLHCNILSSESLSINNSTINNIISLLIDNTNEPDFFNLISKNKTQVGLNNSFTTSISDLSGSVIMTYEFLSGVSGFYCIECQIENGYNFFSNTFYLENEIKFIIISNDQEYIHSIKLHETNDETSQPIVIKLNFISEIKISTTLDISNCLIEEIRIQVYDQKSYMFTSNLDRNNFESYSELQFFWNVLTEGPSSLDPYNSGYISNVIFRSLDIQNNTFFLTDFEFEIPNPGTYRMKYFCRGVQSSFSKSISISKINYENVIEFVLYYRSYILLGLNVVIIFSNSIYFESWTFFASAFLIIVEIIMYAFSEESFFNLLFGEFLLGFVFIILIYHIIMSFKNGNESNFQIIKKKNNLMYSRNLILKLLISKLLINIEISTKKHSNNVYQRNINLINQSNLNINSNFKIQFNSNKKNLIYFKANSLLRLFKELSSLINFFNSNDYFYYPQRFIISIGLSLFTLVYCTFQVTTYIFSLISALSYLKNVIASSVFTFVNNLLQVTSIKLNYSLTNYDLSNYYLLTSQILSIFTDLETSIKVALIVSNVVASIIFFISIIFLFIRFKRLIFKSRRNEKFMKRIERNNGLSAASDFPGLILGNTALSYIIISFLLTIILGLISNKFFWNLIWDYKITLLILVVPFLIQMIIEIIMKHIIYKENISIRLSCCIQIYDVYCLFSSMLQGIISSFTRILYGIISFFVGLIRFDKNMIPKWINILIMADDVSDSFYSLIFLHASNSNPLFCHFNYLLIETPKSRTSNCIKRLWITYLIKKFVQIKKSVEKIG